MDFLDPADVQAIDAQASILMKQGIGILGGRQGGDVAKALAYFDRALELRSRLPIERAPGLRYGLAACWLNRADALMRLEDATQISLALRAYDEALALLRELPLGDDSRFPRRLAIAHQNRGLALHAQGGHAAAAVAAFTDAIATLDDDRAALIADRDYLRAAVWMNLANARASEETRESDSLAHDAALRAIALVTGLEVDDADAAEVGLKARHVVCQVIARHLSLKTSPDETMPHDVHDATDIVDEGLLIVREWEQRGVTRFRRVACDLFRFGARVFEKYQPHFLNEFVLENIDPERSSAEYVGSAEMRGAAQEALAAAARFRESAGRTGPEHHSGE